jgi:2-dehydropantoate 2-reductase
MKVCVFGAGAIGGHVAARLARGGAETSVVARGEHLAAIQRDGLTVEAHDGVHHLTVAAGEPAALGPQDVVVVTVKAPSLPQVARAIGPLLAPETAVVFLMNGIPWWYFDRHGGPLDGRRRPALDPDDAVRHAVGVERTVGGVVYSSCWVRRPGVVAVETTRDRVILGEVDGSPSPRAEALAALLTAGGLPGEVTASIRSEVWAKLVGNLGNGPFAVLSRQGMAGTLADPVVRRAVGTAMREALAIAAGLGRTVDEDPEERVALLSTRAHKPSILQDLELGRPMEIDALFRVPLELARLSGVPTPTLDLAVALVTQAAVAAGLYPEPAASSADGARSS